MKESMETEMTVLASKKKQHIMVIKKRSDTDLEFFPGFSLHLQHASLLDHVQSKVPLKNGAHKLSSPYIFMAYIRLYAFTLSRLTVNC